MPYGIIVNSIAVILGGILGEIIKSKKIDKYIKPLNNILGISAFVIGINSIVKVNNILSLAMSIIIGSIIGLFLNLEENLTDFIKKIIKKTSNKNFDTNKLVVITTILCFSGTGIYGSLISGLFNNHDILFIKAILDFFTTVVFAISLGYIVSFLGGLQFLILMLFYSLAQYIMPMTNNEILLDFTACGGTIMLVTGLRILEIKNISILNMIPALLICMPLSFILQYIF